MVARMIVLAGVVALLTAACGSEQSSEGVSSSSSKSPPTPSADSSVTDDSDAVRSLCDGFEERYLGEGLFVSLPAAATGLTAQTTSDVGPIHAATAVDFDLGDGVEVTVGRRVGSSAVIFVEADSPDLKRCLLEGSRYDPARDQED